MLHLNLVVNHPVCVSFMSYYILNRFKFGGKYMWPQKTEKQKVKPKRQINAFNKFSCNLFSDFNRETYFARNEASCFL